MLSRVYASMQQGPPNSDTPRPMEVWHADVRFEGSEGSKLRPVVVLGRIGTACDVMICTTHPHPDHAEYMRPMESYEAGLGGVSYIRTDRIFKVPLQRFKSMIGELGEDDAAVLEAKYNRLRKGRR